jgi:hypothetical protein
LRAVADDLRAGQATPGRCGPQGPARRIRAAVPPPCARS